MNRPTCAVGGMVAPGGMCGKVIGGKHCGHAGPCGHKGAAAPAPVAPPKRQPKICIGCGARQQPDGSLLCGH